MVDRQDPPSALHESIAASPSKVWFAGRVRVREVEPVEKEVVWYTDHEMKQIKKDARGMLQKLRRNMLVEDDDTTIHGLEEKADREMVRKHKSEAMFAVFEEQQFQIKDSGCLSDHDMIADVYFESSCLSQKLALYRGLRTAKEVQIQSSDSAETKNQQPTSGIYLFNDPKPRIKSAVCA